MQNKVLIYFLYITIFYCNTRCWYSSQKVKQQQITAAPEFYHYTYRQFHCINVRRIENYIFCATFLLQFSIDPVGLELSCQESFGLPLSHV